MPYNFRIEVIHKAVFHITEKQTFVTTVCRVFPEFAGSAPHRFDTFSDISERFAYHPAVLNITFGGYVQYYIICMAGKICFHIPDHG